VAGDVLTMKEFLAIYQETTGRHLTERRLGSVQELKDWIEQKKGSYATSLMPVMVC
jgi:hypothetical protein